MGGGEGGEIRGMKFGGRLDWSPEKMCHAGPLEGARKVEAEKPEEEVDIGGSKIKGFEIVGIHSWSFYKATDKTGDVTDLSWIKEYSICRSVFDCWRRGSRPRSHDDLLDSVEIVGDISGRLFFGVRTIDFFDALRIRPRSFE